MYHRTKMKSPQRIVIVFRRNVRERLIFVYSSIYYEHCGLNRSIYTIRSERENRTKNGIENNRVHMELGPKSHLTADLQT